MGETQATLEKDLADADHSGLVHLVLISRKLSGGGAQRQIIETARNLDKRRFKITVVTLYPSGLLSQEIEEIPGVDLFSLDKSGRYDLYGSIRRFLDFCRQRKVNLIWTYSGGFEYALAAKVFSKIHFIFGIRHSGLVFGTYHPWQAFLFRLQDLSHRLLSRRADVMVANSYAGRKFFGEHGYDGKRILVIPNGYDIERFAPSATSRATMRGAWGVADETIVVGLVGRVDPQKDHVTFLKSAANLNKRMPEVRFACIGESTESAMGKLRDFCDELGIASAVSWLGAAKDMPAVYSALDVLVLCSAFGEGVPNVVGEAMSCQTVSVVTDIGDCALLLNDSNRTVPIKDPAELAAAIERVCRMKVEERKAIGLRDRKRIESFYSLDLLAQRTATVVSGIVRGESVESIDREISSVGIGGS